MNFLKRPLVLTVQFAVVVLAFAVLVAKMGFWWGPLITNYPAASETIWRDAAKVEHALSPEGAKLMHYFNLVLQQEGGTGWVLNTVRNQMIVGFLIVGIVLIVLLYGVISMYVRNRKLEQQLDALSSRLDQVEITEKQKVFPALRSLLKMLEVVKPPQGSQEFAGHLAQVMSLVGQIRRVAKPQIQVTAIDGEPVGDESDDVDLDEVLAKIAMLDSKCDGNAAAIGEIQETLEISGVNADAETAREKAKDAAAKPAVTPPPAAP